MYEKLQRHSNPSSGLDGTAQTGDWLSKHTHICSCKHTLAHVWRVHERMHVWKMKTHTNPSSGLDGTTQTCYWYSKHTHICLCKHTLAHVWRVHEGMHVWQIESSHKSIIRARWNNTNLLLQQQTYTHLLVQAHARSRMTSARRHACMKNLKHTQIHHQG